MARSRGKRASKTRVAEGIQRIAGTEIPFEIWEEDRRDTRFSLTTRMAYLRLPRRLNRTAKQEQITAFEAWLGKVIDRRPDLMAAQAQLDFRSGGIYQLGDIKFRLEILEQSRKTGNGRITGRPDQEGILPLTLKLPSDISARDRGVLVERLLYRLAAKHKLPRIEEILDEANDTHFRVAVGRIKMSPTTSRWGSCSSTGNINLSTRLLGAPEFCLRAVIIHELAHRIEMNHSDRFWKLVYDAMPEYGKADRWLKERGARVGWIDADGAAP